MFKAVDYNLKGKNISDFKINFENMIDIFKKYIYIYIYIYIYLFFVIPFEYAHYFITKPLKTPFHCTWFKSLQGNYLMSPTVSDCPSMKGLQEGTLAWHGTFQTICNALVPHKTMPY